jgi:3-hydroxybutyryl-CoA dehydrogenase
MKSTPRRICILGESPLLEEYATLCVNQGFAVQVRYNSQKETPPSRIEGVRRVTRLPKAIDIVLELTNLSLKAKKKNLIEIDNTLPDRTPILSSSVTVTAAQQARWLTHGERLTGIGALPSLLENGLLEIAPSPNTDEATVSASVEFARALGKEFALVKDTAGLVLPRILCMLVNEACFALMDGVAPPYNIDEAMKLGANYPFGPFTWAEQIGLRQVHAVIAALYKNFKEERYKPAPLLAQAAVANTFPLK